MNYQNIPIDWPHFKTLRDVEGIVTDPKAAFGYKIIPEGITTGKKPTTVRGGSTILRTVRFTKAMESVSNWINDVINHQKLDGYRRNELSALEFCLGIRDDIVLAEDEKEEKIYPPREFRKSAFENATEILS